MVTNTSGKEGPRRVEKGLILKIDLWVKRVGSCAHGGFHSGGVAREKSCEQKGKGAY